MENRERLPHRGSVRKKLNTPVQYRARYILNNAIQSKKIIKTPCVVCGDLKSQGHHKDYSKPLEVMWLCDRHHKEQHAKERAER